MDIGGSDVTSDGQAQGVYEQMTFAALNGLMRAFPNRGQRDKVSLSATSFRAQEASHGTGEVA
jgi:hypothetical protein